MVHAQNRPDARHLAIRLAHSGSFATVFRLVLFHYPDSSPSIALAVITQVVSILFVSLVFFSLVFIPALDDDQLLRIFVISDVTSSRLQFLRVCCRVRLVRPRAGSTQERSTNPCKSFFLNRALAWVPCFLTSHSQ